MNDFASMLQTLSPDGQVPKGVVSDGYAAHAIKNRLIIDDMGRSIKRSKLKHLINGGAPFDEATRRKQGREQEPNVNFMRAYSMAQEKVDSYWDLMTETIRHFDVGIEWGSIWQSEDASEIVSTEFQRLISRWHGFHDLNAQSDFNRVYFGCGLQYFPDNLTWQPRAADAGDFFIPKSTTTRLEDLQVIMFRRRYTASQLYSKIADPEKAAQVGWNVKAVRKAISEASQQEPQFQTWQSWEEMERMIKAHDLYMSTCICPTISTMHLLSQEFDGSITLQIVTELNDNTELLYEKKKWSESFNRVINPFFISKQDGYWHAVNGLGAQFFNVLSLLDRLDNHMVWMTMIGSSLVIQPQTANDFEKLNMVSLGGVTVLPPGVNLQTTAFPNLSTNSLATRSVLQQTLQNTTGAFLVRSEDINSNQQTATEVATRISQLAKVSGSQQNQWSTAWSQWSYQMFRRATNPNLNPDSCHEWEREACCFQKRLREKLEEIGVPYAATQENYLQYVRHVRSTGNGSPAMRMMQAQQFIPMIPMITNPAAQERAKKDVISWTLGYKTAERYFPDNLPKQETNEMWQAMIENTTLNGGTAIPVMDGQNPQIHAGVHLAEISKQAIAYTQQQLDQQVFLQALTGHLPHIGQHLQLMQNDPTTRQQFDVFAQQFAELNRLATAVEQRVGESIQAQQQQALKMAQEQQQAMQINPIEVARLQLDTQKQEHREQMDKAKLAMKVPEQRQKAAIADVNTALAIKNSANQQTRK